MTEEPFEGWAMLELMGHRQRMGFVREVEMFGGKLLRIDIPTDGGDVTEFYGIVSVYALRPAAEHVVRDAAKNYGDPRPVNPVDYQPRIASHTPVYDDDDIPV
jgi:hypothetical protein